ncbi:hypothetical protein ACFS7Z_04830 [Pontibacter toksunensis]|uniref:SMP-30/gluconolaconase/LRE-like protein n=1 Tax=Pontibacter toksunensis TaxID=1332631 RepID=A0ABW6BUC6_9BACT
MYLLDGVNHRMYTLIQQGLIQKTTVLDRKQLRQPEGLAFSDTGDIYVASESGLGPYQEASKRRLSHL